MNYRERVIELIKNINKIEKDGKFRQENALPENCFFINENEIACFPRKIGDSRYPYSHDGFTLWAHSSGYLSVNESTFYVILPASGGKEPFTAFFVGFKNKKGGYDNLSLFEVLKQCDEKNCKRYTIFTPKAVYYITRTNFADFALRAFVNDKKELCFSLIAISKAKTDLELYLSAYINCFLKHDTAECVETNWFKECSAVKNGYVFESVEDLDRTTHLTHFGVIDRKVTSSGKFELNVTTSRSVFTGGTNVPLMCAESLENGVFSEKKEKCKFTDTPVAGDIISFKLGAGEVCRIDYRLSVCQNKATSELMSKQEIKDNELDSWLSKAEEVDAKKQLSPDMLRVNFSEWEEGKIKPNTLNNFISNVIRQAEFAALSKNSGVALLGVRDVFQQIEAALIWNPKACRVKIIEALGFIDITGRPPRQYSIPANENIVPRMDLRAFIDQGVWIINTIYTYLSYTNDYSLLDEICGYYEFLTGNQVKITKERDSVLQHLIRITDYLIKNIDYEYTNCLRAIYGDWNDALDGLGTTEDKGKEYGSGVSVMASLQFYQNLGEMSEILERNGKNDGLIEKYKDIQEKLKQGLITHALEKNEEGEIKILHGWGDKKNYKICSFKDTDGKSREGLTSNAFWVIADALKWDKSIKNSILNSYEKLDSKYGLKTFEPYFPQGMKGVGRIINLPPGTAENAATYVHASLFGIWSLFKMGEPKFAFEQLEKVLPITHKNLTTTPFIMSNSYSLNEEFGMDGESMSDWYTGSSNTLIKVIVRCIFGINPVLNGVYIKPSGYFPCKTAEIKLSVKNSRISLKYENKNIGSRKFYLNGKEINTSFDEFLNTEFIFLSDDKLSDDMRIKIIN